MFMYVGVCVHRCDSFPLQNPRLYLLANPSFGNGGNSISAPPSRLLKGARFSLFVYSMKYHILWKDMLQLRAEFES